MLNIKDLSEPDLPVKENYGEALEEAMKVFERKDPGRVAIKAGADFDAGKIVLPHLDRFLVLDVGSRRVSIAGTKEEAPVWLAILAMHYLNNAAGGRPTGKLKSFREFKEGSFYEPAFNSKTKEVLIRFFGDDPAPMAAAAPALKGRVVEGGDAAVELPYFPNLPITCIVWQGDEEFPPEASVLFDETAEDYFSAEDMAVAGQMAVLELVRAAGK